MVHLNQADVNAVGVLLPLVVGFVSHWSSGGRPKALLLAVLAVVSSLVVTITQNHGLVTQDLLVNFAVQYGLGVASHYGLWKPTGATKAALANGLSLFKNPVSTVATKLQQMGIEVPTQSVLPTPTPAQASLELARTLLDQK